jgi:hypothetical protein
MKNPAGKITNRTDKEWLRLGREAKAAIEKNLAAGMAPDDAVLDALRKIGYRDKLSAETVKAISTAMTTGIDLAAVVGAKEIERVLLSTFYDPSGVPLSSRIWENGSKSMQDVSKIVTAQWRKNKAWTTAAQNLHTAIPPAGDIPKVFSELNTLGRKAMAGNDAAIKAYRKALASAEAQIKRLQGVPLSTERLKTAYTEAISQIDKAVASGTTEAIDKAIDRAMFEKARYNSIRLVRTESARGYFDGFKARMLDDDDVVGWQSVLSSSHEIYDVCDFYATADLHGMGPGVYPKTFSPQMPYHPSCLCIPVPVTAGEVGNVIPDNDAAIDHIESLSEEEQKSLMGESGYEAFQDNPERWMDLMRGWSNYKENSISTEINKIYNK